MATDTRDQWAPLQQVRVLNVGTAWAGRVAAMLLADQGADVVEVRRPEGEPHPCDPLLGRGKRLIDVDLKSEAGRGHVAELAAGADIVIENMRPGASERLGLGYETLRARNPGLVYLALPGFAAGDPQRECPAWEGVIDAAVGIYTDINPVGALLGRDPIYSAIPMASAYGGILGACTASLGFYHRQRTGIGQRFEVPLADAVLSAMALLIVEVEGKPARYGFPPIDPAIADAVFPVLRDLHDHLTPEHMAQVSGYLRTLSSPMVSTYPCADGRLLFMVASDHMYQTRAFLEVLGVYEQLIAEGMVAASPYAESGLDNNLYEANKLSPAWRELVRTAIGNRLLTKPATEWEALLRRAKVPVTVVRTTAEWLEQPALFEGGVTADLQDPDLGAVRQAGRFVSIEGPQTASPPLAPRVRAERGAVPSWRGAALDYPAAAAVAAGTPILQGLKVLDFSNIIAGPAAGRTLAEFGADVIRIDAPAPQAGPFATMWFGIDVNQGKRAIILDLKTDTGRTALAQLVQDTDVVLHNFLDRSAQALGISHEQLAAINPNIISCQISAWGGAGGGPFKDDPAFDPVLQAASGIMMRYGSQARPVLHGIASCVDYMTGFSAVLGIAQALAARQMGRGGAYVRTSLAMAAQLVQFPFMTAHAALGQEPSGQEAKGEGVHQRLYCLADGWAFVGFRPAQSAAVAAALESAAATVEALSAQLRTLTLSQVQQRLAAIPGAGVGAVCTLAELRQARTLKGDGQLENGLPNGSFVLVRGPHPSGLPTTLPLPTWFRPSQSRICYLHPAPFPGEHTAEVLKEAGWAEPEIAQMIADGVARNGWAVLPRYLPA